MAERCLMCPVGPVTGVWMPRHWHAFAWGYFPRPPYLQRFACSRAPWNWDRQRSAPYKAEVARD